MNSELSPLIPAIVWCCHQLLVAVRLPDGRIAVTLQSLCKALHLNRPGQLQRIHRKKSLAKHLLLVPIATRGGWQRMDVLIAEAIPLWLDDIQASRLSPEKRELILALQEKVVDTLHRHFSEMNAGSPQRERPTVSSDAPTQMIDEAMQTIGEAAHLIVGAMQTVGEAVQRLAAEQQTTNERLSTLEDRHEAIEETQRAIGARQGVTEEKLEAIGEYAVETSERVTVLEQHKRSAPSEKTTAAPPADGPILSPQQLAQVYVLAREERQRSGTPVSAQLAGLAEAFGVPDVSDLPAAAWDEVLTWFWERRKRD